MGAEVYAEDGYYAVIPEWVLDADVSAQAIRLYAVLRRYADQRTMHAHPSRRVLAERLQVADVKVVDRALADLTRVGAVSVYPRHTEDGDRSSNGYILHRGPKVSPQGGGRNAIGGGGPNAMTVGVQTGEEPQPVEPQKEPPLPPAAAGAKKTSAPPSTDKPRRRLTPAPDNFTITDKLRGWAAEKAPGIDIGRETEQFLDHHRAKGNTFKDWDAAWRTWMTNAMKFASNGAGTRPANGRPLDAAAEYRSRFHPDVPPWEIM